MLVSELNLYKCFWFFFSGKRVKLNPPENVHVQWAEKGSYRLEHMLETISHLPNRFNMFTQKNYAIYVLDNYAVHLQEEVRKALLDRGYILILIGGGITGDLQVLNSIKSYIFL